MSGPPPPPPSIIRPRPPTSGDGLGQWRGLDEHQAPARRGLISIQPAGRPVHRRVCHGSKSWDARARGSGAGTGGEPARTQREPLICARERILDYFISFYSPNTRADTEFGCGAGSPLLSAAGRPLGAHAARAPT